MFKFSTKASGLSLLEALLILLVFGMLACGVIFALNSYTNILSFINHQVVKSVSTNVFKTVSIPLQRHQQIIINLDDNKAFGTLPISSHIMFPFMPEKKVGTEWPAGLSGFLVKSYDGINIEMLGYRYTTISRAHAGSGYNALSDLLANNNQEINEDNINYPYLYVWIDHNENGQVDKGELFSLKTLGIASINVGSMQPVNERVNSSVITRKGSYSRVNGSKGSILEVDLFQDPFYREFLSPIEVPDDLNAIPNVQGTGLVRDLREASTKSPTLLAGVLAYYNYESLSRHYNMLDGLLFDWVRTEELPFMKTLEAISTERFKFDLTEDLKPARYREIHSDIVQLFNNLMVVEQMTGKRQLYIFTKEVLNFETGDIELHLAVSFNNAIIARSIIPASSNRKQQLVLISDDMLNFTDAQKIEINEEYEAIKKNIFDKLQREKPNLKELMATSEKNGYQWVDKRLQSEIKTGEYFVRERKAVDLPRRRYLVECIKPGNIIDQQVRDCADGKIAKTW